MRAAARTSGYRFLLAALLVLLAVSAPGVAHAAPAGAGGHPVPGNTDAQPTLHADRHGQPELSVVVRHVPAPALPGTWPAEGPLWTGERPPPGWSSTREADGADKPRTARTHRSARGPPAAAS